MKQITIFFFVFLLSAPCFAKNESSSRDAGSVVLYGNNNGAIVPIKVDADGVIDVSGGSSGDITSVGDVTSGAAFDGTQGTTFTFNNASGDKTLNYDGTDFLFDAALSVTGAFDASGTITSGGNLTITSTDPAIILNEAATTDTDFWIGNTSDSDGVDDDLFQIGDGSTPGTNPFITVKTDGSVGIGTAAPSEKLDIIGNIKAGTVSTGASGLYWNNTLSTFSTNPQFYTDAAEFGDRGFGIMVNELGNGADLNGSVKYVHYWEGIADLSEAYRTSISTHHDGKPYVYGYDLTKLAEVPSFTRTIYLILAGRMPDKNSETLNPMPLYIK